MEITGYHGTTLSAMQNILQTKKFEPSEKPNEWLGDGVYFFTLESNAKWWSDMQAKRFSDTPTILSAAIKCCDDECFDLDCKENMQKVELLFKNYFCTNGRYSINVESEHEIAALACNYYAMKNPHFKIFMCTFISKYMNKLNVIGFHAHTLARQLCIKDDACIVKIERCEENA